MHRLTKSAVLCLLVTLGLSACVGGPKPFLIKGDGAPVLNRDINGKSLSVVVRVLQLKNPSEFAKLTFDTLADGRPESELLGPDLLAKADAIIVPGESFSSTEKLLEDTRYVGVVAYFRNPDPHYWRYLIDADTVRSNGLSFKVEDCYIALRDIKPLPIPGQPINAKPQCQTANFAPIRNSSQPATRSGNAGNARQPANAAQPARQGNWLQQNMPNVNVNVGGGQPPAQAPAQGYQGGYGNGYPNNPPPANAPSSGNNININVGPKLGW